MNDPFDLRDAVVRDLPHARVTRHAPHNGRHCEYRKSFKAEGLCNASYWTQRENLFLLDFRVKKLRHTVQLSAFTQVPDGQHTPVFETVATYDAGITIEDWLRVRPKYASGEVYGHPFKHTGLFLSLIRACLVALKEIHKHNIVHCDIKADNICLPYSPYPFKADHPIHIDFKRVRLIDFAFSVTPEWPLDYPLPIAAKAEYQSNLLKAALDQDLSHTPGGTLHAQQLDCRADLYSLGFLAERILHLGLLQPQGASGRAAQDGAHRIVECLKAFDDGAEDWDGALPHDGLIEEIDVLLKPLTDTEAYREFSVEAYQHSPSHIPTPMAVVMAEIPLENQSAGDGGNPDNIAESVQDKPKNANGKSHQFVVWLVASLFAAATPLAFYNLMLHGYLDWTGVCTMPDDDRQIRHCHLLGFSLGEQPSHYPASSVELKKLSSTRVEDSKDKSLRVGLDADKYRIGDAMQIQISVARPLFVNAIQRKASGGFEIVYSNAADKPIAPGNVVSVKTTLKGPPGAEQLIAIALEQPFPNDIVPIDEAGKLTGRELDLQPVVARLKYQLDPAPARLDCVEGKPFADSVDRLWPHVQADEADAKKVWKSALNTLSGVLSKNKTSPASRQNKTRALACLLAMGHGKDSEAIAIVERFRQGYKNYRKTGAFVDWLIDLEQHPHAPPPDAYPLWWENGQALAANGDDDAKNDQAYMRRKLK